MKISKEDYYKLKKLYQALEKVKQAKLGIDWESAKDMTEVEDQIKNTILEINNKYKINHKTVI